MRFRRFIAAFVVAISSITGIGLAAAAPANAGVTYVYPIYHYQVCQRQGHFGASYYNPWSPYSWYCYDLSFPLGVTWAGGLDFDGYCRAKYGARAELWSRDAWGWRCVRRT